MTDEQTIPQLDAKLVIFDCDGVLVDSEILYAKVEQQSLRALGIELSLEQMHQEFTGMSYPEMLDRISEMHDVDFPDHYGKDHPERLDRLFEEELRAIHGMQDLLPAINRPVCVASNSKLTRVRLSLNLTNLIGHFDEALFAAEMVSKPKPAPDLFLHAAAEHGISPQDCIVIEDSTHGVHAARAAGMQAIGLAAGSHCGPDHEDRLRGAGACYVTSEVEGIRSLMHHSNLLIA